MLWLQVHAAFYPFLLLLLVLLLLLHFRCTIVVAAVAAITGAAADANVADAVSCVPACKRQVIFFNYFLFPTVFVRPPSRRF